MSALRHFSGSRRRWLVGAGVALAAAAAGAWFAQRRYTPRAPADLAVETLLAQTLTDSDGNSVALSRYRGRVLVVNFWATWCPPCIEEMPELSALASEFAARGVDVLGIGVDAAVSIRQFAARWPVVYPLLIAQKTGYELSRQFGNRSLALPFTVVVDRDGRIIERTLGRFKADALRASTESALRGS